MPRGPTGITNSTAIDHSPARLTYQASIRHEQVECGRLGIRRPRRIRLPEHCSVSPSSAASMTRALRLGGDLTNP
jgi:hypothetical protein